MQIKQKMMGLQENWNFNCPLNSQRLIEGFLKIKNSTLSSTRLFLIKSLYPRIETFLSFPDFGTKTFLRLS